jgi:hypothetical protein
MTEAPLSFPPPGIVPKDVVQALDGMQLKALSYGLVSPVAPVCAAVGNCMRDD